MSSWPSTANSPAGAFSKAPPGGPDRPSPAKRSALAVLTETHDLPAERVGPDTPASTILRAQADHLDATGHSTQALECYQTLLDQRTRGGTDAEDDLRDAVVVSRMYSSLARITAGTGDAAGAAALTARRLELWRHWESTLPGNAFVLRQLRP